MSSTWPVYNLGVIDSTNTEARRRAKAGAFENCWLVAEAQTAGRGRLQREWISPTGNLFSTALFHEPGGIRVAARIPFAAALAVSDVVSQLAPDAQEELVLSVDVTSEVQVFVGHLPRDYLAQQDAYYEPLRALAAECGAVLSIESMVSFFSGW